MAMTGMIKAVALVGGLGLASGAAATVGTRPLALLLDFRQGIEEMQLTTEQKGEIRDVFKAHRAEVRRAADRLWDARMAVHEATGREPLDEALIRRRAAAAAAASGDLAVARARVRAEIRGLLNDEQRVKADALHDKLLKDVAGLRDMAREYVDERLESE
jgi:Spy/CpxP family protein refolding chaperone